MEDCKKTEYADELVRKRNLNLETRRKDRYEEPKFSGPKGELLVLRRLKVNFSVFVAALSKEKKFSSKKAPVLFLRHAYKLCHKN